MADAVQKELGLEVDWPGLKTALLTATTRLHDKLAVLKVSEHLRAPEIVDRNPLGPPARCLTRSHPPPDAPLSRAQILDSTSPHWPGVVECNESVRVKASDIVDWGFTQANTIPPLKAQILKLDKELKLARSEISELNGVVESNAAEIEGLKEDLAVNIAGYDAEKAEKEERIGSGTRPTSSSSSSRESSRASAPRRRGCARRLRAKARSFAT